MQRVVTFYHFIALTDPAGFARWLSDWTLRHRSAHSQIKGTVLVAPEGINATLWADQSVLASLVAEITRKLGIDALNVTYSGVSSGEHKREPFQRLKIRVKDTILTFPVSGLDPAALTGEHVGAREWNALLDDSEVIVVDTRNRYEVAIGRFENALDPSIESFAEFPAYVDRSLTDRRERPIAMYCTGGIRCEKASADLLSRGFRRVYQLRGGILKYLAQMPPEHSRWEGACFVFDDRGSLTSALEPVRSEASRMTPAR